MAVQCRKKDSIWKSVTAAKVSLLEWSAGNIEEIKELTPTSNSINSHAKGSSDKEDKHRDAVAVRSS